MVMAAITLLRRSLCSAAERSNAPVKGAFGSRASRGSGQSLVGSSSRGTGALTPEEKARIESGEEYITGTELEAGDVLMEVLAEDHRFARNVEFSTLADGEEAPDDEDGDAQQKQLPLGPHGPGMAHRPYLTHKGVGAGTIFERQRAAQRQRLAVAQESAFSYRMPEDARKQREHERRSRARQRGHDVIENRIQEAMAEGAFDDLSGAGRPLPLEENAFEAISGEALVNKVPLRSETPRPDS